MPDNLFKKLENSGKLPTPPGVVLRLLEVTRLPDVSAAQIAEVIGADPGLTGKIIRFVNSPLAGVGREVTSIQHAVALLGMRAVKMMALSLSVLTRQPNCACKGFDSARFCLQSLACAVAAKTLAAATKTGSPHDAHLAGLLSQVGRSALATALPEEYARVLAAAQVVPRDLPSYEQAAFRTTYAGVGAHLLRSWGLPESICVAIEAFRSLEHTPQASPLAQVLFVAEVAVEVLCAETAVLDGSDVARFVTAARQYFAFNDEQCANTLQQAAKEFQVARAFYDLPTGTRSVEDLESEIRERITELGLAMHLENQSLVQRQEELLHRATTDPLTGVGNRAAFDARLTLELQRAARDGSSLGLLMIDVDHFKKFNDTHGHQAGDRVLQNVAQVFENTLRKVDYVARYGGEEFAVIAPATSPEGLLFLAERIRSAVEAARLRWEKELLRITVSIGIGAAGGVSDTEGAAVALIRAADQNLYAAKCAGRNRVCGRPVDQQPLQACTGVA